MNLEQIIRGLPPKDLAALLQIFAEDGDAFLSKLKKVLTDVGSDYAHMSRDDYAELMRLIPQWVDTTLTDTYNGGADEFHDNIEGFNGIPKQKVSQYIRETSEVSKYVLDLMISSAWNSFAEFVEEYEPLFLELLDPKQLTDSERNNILHDPKKIFNYAREHGYKDITLYSIKGIWNLLEFVTGGLEDAFNITFYKGDFPGYVRIPSPPAYPH